MSGNGFQVSIDGPSRLLAKLGNIQNVIFPVAKAGLEEGAISIHRHAVISIQSHESVDHIEHRYSPNRDAEVSAPGNPPNKDLGTLSQSIKWEPEDGGMTVVVGTNLEYGRFLEMGTSKMEPRPWLYPAFEAHRDEIKANVAQAINEKLEGMGA